MLRRNFIKTGAFGLAMAGSLNSAISGAGERPAKIKPRALSQGDTIGLIAPATSVSDPDDLAKAFDTVAHFGLKLKAGKSLTKGSGYKSRSIKERADDLHEMFADSSVSGIFCIRGGYGSAQLLPHLDYNLIRQNPKIFCGFSDITALHIGINKKTGLVTFHGPGMLSAFSSFTEENFNKLIFGKDAAGLLKNPESKSNFRPLHPTRTIVAGRASGELVGGNLSLISALMGTDYEIDARGKILFIEDVGEEPYRIDRMLTQMNLSGKLGEAAVIAFGECSGCNYDGLQASRVWDYSLGEVLDRQLGDLKVPVFYGLAFGHTSDQLTLPLGVEAELDADARTLTLKESAVR